MRFLIYSFDYDWKSGGNVVLHDLGKILSQKYTTYVFASKTVTHSKAICVNADKAKEIAIQEDVITIYPEVISGNPFNAKNVVRYVLYYPGWHAGDKEYDINEFIITYDKDYVKATKYENAFVLTILDPKLNIMKNYNNKRNNIGLLVRKCKDFDYKMQALYGYKDLIKLPVISIDDIIIKAAELKDLCKIYNNITMFISFDPHTYHSTIAALCGCTSVVIPSKELSSDDFYNVTKYGVAYGFKDIDYAKSTYNKMVDNLKLMEQNTFIQCDNFVKIVQNHYIKKI